mmetsp:Transcript_12322/g.35733  ORF Transcript_12322/g.35733 Transcript_12322/m.35733 type:complete len:982 (+) Transcript_12322:89-3034(+)|eukprot:CAMPEP_0119545606 /NCGR_PEP_ID=MMETSP1352-20130426/311_1 /TAXON_ID=265584 /ORGANISM="Stauroneis constricta, Strain CCMP1120" /LENGTH=981 /DNA_ID=CAMNT_0007590179 /DNA_START=76 /DNA_END=3021 /DNA_ORIENTATION=-
MKYSEFDESVFRKDVAMAVKTVKRVMDVDRNPNLAESVDHTYENKFDMSEQLTNTSIIAAVNILQEFGLTSDILIAAADNGNKSKTATTLRFQSKQSSEFLKEENVEIDTGKTYTTTTKKKSTFFGTSNKTVVNKMVRKAKEYHWNVHVEWQLGLFSGNDDKAKTILQSRKTSVVIVTQRNESPTISIARRKGNNQCFDVSLTWLLQQAIDTSNMAAAFKIDRSDAKTKTPRRNEQTDAALEWFDGMTRWCKELDEFAQTNLQGLLTLHNPVDRPPQNQSHLRSVFSWCDGVFCPVLPFMEDRHDDSTASIPDVAHDGIIKITSQATTTTSASQDSKSRLLSSGDMNQLLNEQIRSIQEAKAKIRDAFPAKQLAKLISAQEATVVMMCVQMNRLRKQHQQALSYVEEMLRQQLISAIGKSIQPQDLEQFVRYHNAKFLNRKPLPFCHSIRRPDYSPEGLVSIEHGSVDDVTATRKNTNDEKDSDRMEGPIETMCRKVVQHSASPLHMPINAGTTLQLNGDTYLHGWMRHHFVTDDAQEFHIAARARQFSSFILIIGNMAGPNQLNPKDAIIVQNKDEVFIPLLLNDLPTSKEFKRAVKSLSPEQLRFAEAFRGMQLESSVFGICIVQIKPQLEKLLNLPDRALTKEMELTNSLMDLFIEYQVPSDLLSYSGPQSAALNEKLAAVKSHVANVMSVIECEKVKQVEEQTKKAEMSKQMMYSRFGSNSLASSSGSDDDDDPSYGSVEYCERGDGAMDLFECEEEEEEEECCDDYMSMCMDKEMAIEDETNIIQEEGDQMDGNQESASDDQPSPTEAATMTPNPQIATTNFTLIPKLLDAAVDKYDTDHALRTTIIKTQEWKRKRQANLLTKPKMMDYDSSEYQKAMDLLDAMSRSGSLTMDATELHVIVAMAHCFENDIMGTIIQDNMNPIEKLERSTLLLGSTIHGVAPQKLVASSDLSRLEKRFPLMLGGSTTGAADDATVA